MNLPPSDFADAFREHVVPKLHEVIVVRAHFVGIGLYGFADAHADVMAYAAKLGASLLPEEHLDALIDWALTELCDAAAAVEAQCVR
jgi:hypothetical protein